MKVKALVSFSGAFSMYEGEVRECSDDSTLQNLLQVKYVEEVKEEPNKEIEMGEEIEKLRQQIEELKQAKEEVVKEEEPKQAKQKSPKKPKEDVKSKNDSKSDNK